MFIYNIFIKKDIYIYNIFIKKERKKERETASKLALNGYTYTFLLFVNHCK